MIAIYETPSFVNYSGIFNNEIRTDINNEEKTNSLLEALDKEKQIMNNNKYAKELQSLLYSRFNNDIELLAKTIGMHPQDVKDLIEGVANPSKEFIKTLESKLMVDTVQFGDKIIFESGGTINNYSDKSIEEKLKILELENSDLRKMMKDKNELIESLKENIRLSNKK